VYVIAFITFIDLLGVHVYIDGNVCDDTSEHVKDGPVTVGIDTKPVRDRSRLCGWRNCRGWNNHHRSTWGKMSDRLRARVDRCWDGKALLRLVGRDN